MLASESAESVNSQLATCWICRGTDDDEAEVGAEPLSTEEYYCDCRGSLGTVHRRCLESVVRRLSLSRCRTCGGAYTWEMEVASGTPNKPDGTAARTVFVARAFVARFSIHVALTLVALVVKFVGVPISIGLFHHALREEWNADAAADDTLFTALVVGSSLSALRRGVAKMHRKHAAFFAARGDDVRDEPPANPDASGRAHDQLWWWANRVRRVIAPPESDGDLKAFAMERARDLVAGVAMVYLWFRVALMFALVGVLAAAVVLRFTHAPRKYKNRRQRREEILEAQKTLTRFEIRKYFATFCLDCLFFSIAMRVVAGYAFHYATAPYFCNFPTEFFWPTPESALVHWFIGFFIENFMVYVERNLMAPLFALGCDLIILRSVLFDEEHDQYMFVFQQLYEVDPLRAFADAVRIYATEIPALILWIHLPLRAAHTGVSWIEPPFGTWGSPLGPLPLPVFVTEGYAGRAAELLVCVSVLLCFFSFPVQRCALKVMYPVAAAIARITGLTAYVFDPRRREALERWLQEPLPADGDDVGIDAEAALPPVSPEQKVTRREMWMDAGDVPSILWIRRVVFTTLFFPICYSVSIGMFAAASLLLGGMRWGATWSIAAPILAIFGVWSVRKLGFAALQTVFLVVCVPLFTVKAALEPFAWAWSSFVDDTFAAYYNMRQRLAATRRQ